MTTRTITVEARRLIEEAASRGAHDDCMDALLFTLEESGYVIRPAEPAGPVREQYKRLAESYRARPTVPDHGGGVKGDKYPLGEPAGAGLREPNPEYDPMQGGSGARQSDLRKARRAYEDRDLHRSAEDRTNPTMTEQTIVVLGKTSIRKSEYPHLFDIGRAIALRGKTLRTTRTAGAARAVVEGYESERLTNHTTNPTSPQYMNQGEIPDHASVMIFTDKKMEERLTERLPDWRDRGWLVFLNPTGTKTAHEHLMTVLELLGTPLTPAEPSDGGSVKG